MNNKDFNVLYADICARVPYGLKAQVEGFDNATITGVSDYEVWAENEIEGDWYELKKVKPYLRTMSSLTKHEKRELSTLMEEVEKNRDNDDSIIYSHKLFDYLNSIHVDYRGFIDKGIAIEAPKYMYM